MSGKNPPSVDRHLFDQMAIVWRYTFDFFVLFDKIEIDFHRSSEIEIHDHDRLMRSVLRFEFTDHYTWDLLDIFP